jgi:hypothetical protein
MPDMTMMKGGELAAIIRERVLRDMFPVPDKPEFTYIHPKWPHIWAELRTRCGPVRCAFIIVATIVLWPFQLVWWLTHAFIAKTSCEGDTRCSSSRRLGALVLGLARSASCLSIRLAIHDVPSAPEIFL